MAIRYSRERRRLEKALPEFIRDVAEGRKTGLSPEVAIERLSDRHYGILSRHVKKMGAQLSWGVSLSKVIATFTDAVESWVTRAIGTLLVEVVDVGGGTIRSFSEMAEFTRSINDMESDRKAALRPFIYITYIAGVMVVITTFIMVYLLGEPAATGFSTAGTVPSATIDMLLTTAIFRHIRDRNSGREDGRERGVGRVQARHSPGRRRSDRGLRSQALHQHPSLRLVEASQSKQSQRENRYKRFSINCEMETGFSLGRAKDVMIMADGAPALSKPARGKLGYGIDEPRSIIELAVAGFLAIDIGFLIAVFAIKTNPTAARLGLLVGPAVGFLILAVAVALYWSSRQGKVTEMLRLVSDIPWGERGGP